ncbi:MAG: calcium-binding protein [Bdellovibrionota bacterium]
MRSILMYRKVFVIVGICLVSLVVFQNCGKGASGTSAPNKISNNVLGSGSQVSPYGAAILPTMNVPSNIGFTSSIPSTVSTVSNVLVGGGTIYRGTDSSDLLQGGMYDDAIQGNGGNDTINGAAGNDYIHANVGDDIVRAGAGNDIVYGGRGNDQLYGDRGSDIIFGDKGTNTLHGNNPELAGQADDGDDSFVHLVSDVGDTEPAINTIYDRGGSNQLFCRTSSFTVPSGGVGSYVGNDLVLSFGAQGSVTIKDYLLYPFAAIDCGTIYIQ